VTTTVWVAAWQQECCGDAFGVGTSVRWPVVRARGELETLLPADSGVTVGYVQERHGPVHEEDLMTLEGRVRAIRGVELRYVETEPGTRSYRPVPGSGRLIALTAADGAERRGRGFAGYLVDLTPVTHTP
jgi:hypothetical protein